MAQKPIAKTVEEFLNPIVEGLGYEIIDMGGYTATEKKEITTKYIIQKTNSLIIFI